MTELKKGDLVCLKMVVSDNTQLQTLSNRHALECGTGEITEVFKGGLVSVVFPNGSTYTRSLADVFELESEKQRRTEEQGAARLKKFYEKHNRYAA
tara:strand:- start:1214 stop:1501 length:288 start_codon:yes stop_codon:yes gene_type:complete